MPYLIIDDLYAPVTLDTMERIPEIIIRVYPGFDSNKQETKFLGCYLNFNLISRKYLEVKVIMSYGTRSWVRFYNKNEKVFELYIDNSQLAENL